MKPFHLGKRNEYFQRYRFLLFEDRMEEVSYTATSMELTRFYFDEAGYATVHRGRNWPTVVIFLILGVVFLLVTFVFLNEEKGDVGDIGGPIFAGLSLLCMGCALFYGLNPPFVLVIHAPDQTLAVTLPRREGRREAAIQRLLETIEAYQAEHAAAEPSTPVSLPRGAIS